ncbi:MAG: caspase family protein [Lewinellaceae bacterium]|nr:caspase family protein [Lewinellaceae bacterium]
MKIRHKLTGEARELIFNTWRTTIQNKENYKVIDRGDVVYLRQIEKEGYRKYLYQIDRDHAIKMIKQHPHLYDFQELNDLPFEAQARLILEELKWKEGRSGDLGKILNDLKIDFIRSDLKEFANYFEEKGWAGTTLTKDAIPIRATRKGLESLKVPMSLVQPLEVQDLEPDKIEPSIEASPDEQPDEVVDSGQGRSNQEQASLKNAGHNLEEDEQKKGIKFRREDLRFRRAKEGKSWFFGIGIDEYQHFSNLNNAVKDVNDLVILLQEQYDLNAENTWLLFDKEATYRNIIHKLEELVKKVRVNDKLLIYYSGHGHLNDRNRGFWIPSDAEKGIPDKYIRNSTIRDYIKDFPSRHTLLISDSCFSGTLFVRGASRFTAAFDELEQKVSRWALCSGRHDEEVYDGEPGRNSPFAESILEVLDSNQEPKFNVAKLADRVMEITRANYEQLPEGNPIYGVGDKGGQYIFCREQKHIYEDSEEDDLWSRCSVENTIEALSKYLKQYPNGTFASEAIEKIKKCEQDDEAWVKAKQVDRISGYHEYISGFPDGLYRKEAKKRIENLEQAKAISRIDYKPKVELLAPSDLAEVTTNENEYYADLAKLPHQKGKWAVFKDGAQVQGTVRATKREAQSFADGLNNKTRERLTLSNGAYVLENGMPFFGTDQFHSWKYYDEKEGVQGVVLVYLFSMDEVKVVKPNSWNLPKETIDSIELEVNKEMVQLLKMHGIDR